MGHANTRKLPEQTVCSFIAGYEGTPETFRQALADESGVSLKTVKRRLKELEEQGVLRSRRVGKCLVYEVAETKTVGRWRQAKKGLKPHYTRDRISWEITLEAMKDPAYAMEVLESEMDLYKELTRRGEQQFFNLGYTLRRLRAHNRPKIERPPVAEPPVRRPLRLFAEQPQPDRPKREIEEAWEKMRPQWDAAERERVEHESAEHARERAEFWEKFEAAEATLPANQPSRRARRSRQDQPSDDSRGRRNWTSRRSYG